MRLRVLFSQKLGGISWHVGQLFFSSSILRYIFKYEFCQIYLGLFFQDSHRTCVSLSAFSHFLPHYFYVYVSFCVCGCSDFSHGTFSVLLVLICHPPPLRALSISEGCLSISNLSFGISDLCCIKRNIWCVRVSCLLVCLCTMCKQCPRQPEEDAGSSRTGMTYGVNSHVGAGNWTGFLCKSSQ